MEYTISKIAELVDGDYQGDGTIVIHGVAPFEHASSTDITFAAGTKFLKRIDETKAAAIVVPRDFQHTGKLLIKVDNPPVAFAKIMTAFHPKTEKPAAVHPNACIGENFTCGSNVRIPPFTVIENDVTIGNRVNIHPHVYIGDQVTIGDDVEIFPNVTILERCRIGSRVTIHAGSVIGSDGFGFAPDGERHHKIPQLGIVQIDDDVEIGALNAIDRATFGKTWIQKGVKTDNLIQIAHNVTVGAHSILVAQVGISGSVNIGNHVTIAGQAGIAGHLNLGDGAIIGPRCGVIRNIPAGETVLGEPATPASRYYRVVKVFLELPEIKKQLNEFEKRLKSLEKFSDEDTQS